MEGCCSLGRLAVTGWRRVAARMVGDDWLVDHMIGIFWTVCTVPRIVEIGYVNNPFF